MSLSLGLKACTHTLILAKLGQESAVQSAKLYHRIGWYGLWGSVPGRLAQCAQPHVTYNFKPHVTCQILDITMLHVP